MPSILSYSKGTGSQSAVTTAIDTTGATLLVCGIGGAYETTGTTPSISDNAGNVWNWIRRDTSNGYQTEFLLYCPNPITKSGYTFSAAYPDGYLNIMLIAAYNVGSGITISTLDQHNGNSVTTRTLTHFQPGSITPTTNNQLIVTIETTGNAPNATVDSPYITLIQVPSNLSYQSALGYYSQPTLAATNPNWVGTSDGWAAAVASFKVADGGPKNTGSGWFLFYQ